MKYFYQEGANIYAETKTGLNAFHLAAQNDKVNIFLFLCSFKQSLVVFVEYNLDIQINIWSSMENSQIVLFLREKSLTN